MKARAMTAERSREEWGKAFRDYRLAVEPLNEKTPEIQALISEILSALSAARAEAVEKCCRAACVQCGRDIELKLEDGFWRHFYMSGQTASCSADPIRRTLLPPPSSGAAPETTKGEAK